MLHFIARLLLLVALYYFMRLAIAAPMGEFVGVNPQGFATHVRPDQHGSCLGNQLEPHLETNDTGLVAGNLWCRLARQRRSILSG